MKKPVDNVHGMTYSLRVIGKVPKNAPADGPMIGIRFRTRKEVDLMKRAAKEQGLSFNTFVIESAARSAAGVLEANRSDSSGSDLQATA